MKFKADGSEGGKVKEHKGIEGLTLAELRSKWSDVVEILAGDGVKVINPGHALEGALSIRYHWNLHLTLFAPGAHVMDVAG